LQLLDERNDAKNSKDFELSDRLRSKIVKLWYRVIDEKDWTSRVEKL
jgi:cysteinyl-tRNA synthetase